MFSRHVVIPLVFAVGLVLSACDSAPGTEVSESLHPVVSDLRYSPSGVTLGSLPTEQVAEDSIRFDLSVSVRASDPDGEVREVAYAVQPPNAGLTIASGQLVPRSGGRYGMERRLSIPAGLVGKYTVLVFAVDDTGRMSNTLRGSISYAAQGGAPVITEIIADPDTVRVDRDSLLTLTAVVDDPDGPANVARVIVATPNGLEFPMFDDGATAGDEVAGDGRFNARFENVNLATPNTTQVFTFQAFDKSGLASEVVEKAIRIE